MRKLVVLKSIVDFIWFVVCIPAILVVLFFSVYMFINPEAIKMFINGVEYEIDNAFFMFQLLVIVSLVLVSVSIYAFYIFRTTLRYFQQHKPFHAQVITNFNTIGKLLSVVGISGAVLTFVTVLAFKSRISINLGISPYVVLIALGLFFMVLSETFKVAQHAKMENEFTI